MPFVRQLYGTLFLIVSGVLHTSSQTLLYLSDTQTKNLPFINKNVVYLEDTAKLSIDSIRKINDATIFKPVGEKQIEDLGFTKCYYWFKFKIKNTGSINKSHVLVIANPLIKQTELFVESTKGIRPLGTSGSTVPFTKRPYVSNYYAYPISIDSNNSSTYYLFVDNIGQPLLFSLLLFDDTTSKHTQSNIYFWTGILIGIILLTVVINLVLFILIHDKLHLAYSLYSLSAVLLIMATANLDSQFLFPEQSSWNQISRVTTACSSLFLLLIVMRLFLGQKPNNSRYHLLTSIMMYFYAGTAILNYMIHDSSDLSLQKFTIIIFASVVIAGFPIAMLSCIEKLRQGFKPALFYLIAISMPLVGGGLMAINMIGLISNSFSPPKASLYWPPTPLQIGLCIESVIICIGILYRYNLYKKEKNSLSLALEKEKADSAKQVLAVQEEERKRIAEDIHDELGGNLAAIKMTLQSLDLSEEVTQPLLHLIDKTSTNARTISHNLMPPEFKDVNIIDLLNQYYQRLNKEGSILFNFYCSGEVYSFSKDKELMLYRIVLELTHNIIKHAKASNATIQLMYYTASLEIMLEDDGQGFSSDSPGGIGLKNVRSRVSYLNGTVTIDSNIYGTTIMIQVPY